MRESIIAFNQGIEASTKHPSFDVEVDWGGSQPPTEDVIRYSSFFSEMQTYQDDINSLLNESVTLLPELLVQTQNFIEEK